MPLAYDDIPGSWGTYSVNWPYIRFSTEKEHDAARQIVIKEGIVPYGSYVTVGNDLRLETEEYVNIVRTRLELEKVDPKPLVVDNKELDEFLKNRKEMLEDMRDISFGKY